MNWHALASRQLGVAWPSSLGLRLDPYLVWADITGFAGFRVAFQRSGAHAVPIAFELAPGLTPATLRAKMRSLGLPWPPLVCWPRFGTAQVPLECLAALLSPPGQALFRRFEIGLPTQAPADPRLYAALLAQSAGPGRARRGGGRRIAAVIDDGCAFANAAFLKGAPEDTDAPRSRIERLWFQEDRDPIDPRTLGYTAANLDRLFLAKAFNGRHLDEAHAYRLLGDHLRARERPGLAAAWEQQMRAPATHGTHVLDVMAGSPNPLAAPRYRFGSAADAAAQAPIVFVQLPRAAVADTSGASMNCDVLEALAFVASVVRPPDEVVINLSYGALAGPHDGSTLLEEAIDHFLSLHPQVKALTLPAGNGHESRTHARLRATRDGQWHELRFRLLPGDPTDTFVELWYAPSPAAGPQRAALEVEVEAPDGRRSGPLAPGQALQWGAAGEIPIAALLHLEHPSAGAGHKHLALLALAPTLGAARTTAPHGDWTLRVRNRGGHAPIVDAWIERDDSPFGSGRARGQARFLSEGRWPARGHPDAATFPIEREMTLNSFAHGAGPKVAGGCSLRPVASARGEARQPLARYSASGPGRRGAWPGPEVCAPCEESPGVGLLAAGTRSARPATLDGTSVAAAVLARQCLNAIGSSLPPPDEHAVAPPPAPVGDLAPDPLLRRGRGRLEPMPAAAPLTSAPATEARGASRRRRR